MVSMKVLHGLAKIRFNSKNLAIENMLPSFSMVTKHGFL